MSRIEQINELLKDRLANLISKESILADGLITISYVDCSPDLNQAKIGVSILPDNLAGTALKKLRKHNSLFSKILKKELRLRKIPAFRWEIDATEKNAAVLDKIFKQIEEEREQQPS